MVDEMNCSEGSDDNDGASIVVLPPLLPLSSLLAATTATTTDAATTLQCRHTFETTASSTLEVHALCRNHVNAMTTSTSLSLFMME